SLERIVAWAAEAPEPGVAALIHHRLAVGWEDDRARKAKEIRGLECELAGLLVQTPYVLLLSCPGLNVVAAADLAGELGPIILYELVAGQQVFCHPKYKGRHYILKKLAAFHREHDSAAAVLGRDLEAARAQVPAAEYAAEGRALEPLGRRRGRGAKELKEILP